MKRAGAGGVSVSLPKAENPYTSAVQKGLGERDWKLYEGAEYGQKALQMLDRVDEFVKNAPPTGGPIAPIEVWARNFASEYGFPVDKVTDASNAKLTAEFSSFLADQIISGGRGITDEDVRVISRSIPSFGSGIPREQLPAFIGQLRRIATQKVGNWNDRYNSMDPDMKRMYPWSIGNREVKSPGQGGRRKSPQEMTDKELEEAAAEARRNRGG
jgi:hypothetical protein